MILITLYVGKNILTIDCINEYLKKKIYIYMLKEFVWNTKLYVYKILTTDEADKNTLKAILNLQKNKSGPIK